MSIWPLPDGYGGDLIAELRERNPEAQALVLTASLDRAEVARAVESGAAAVINKTAPLQELLADARRLRAGGTVMAPGGSRPAIAVCGPPARERESGPPNAGEPHSPQREILQALADGLDSRQIADRLQISIRTKQNHIASTLSKLGVHSRLQALVFALRYGIVETARTAPGTGRWLPRSAAS